MIVRQWIYQVESKDTDRFEQFEQEYGLPMMQGQAGCLGVELMRQREAKADTIEYSIISHWQSWELLQTGLASSSWREEVELFLKQNFGEGNGVIQHYEVVRTV